ncbi:hypothetical protein MRB53_012675 [Persea americana]|uniref:Uncharacterized protein n=1 Tax=Persea americana TaxID=3435 RepID=A0ACC2LYF2_PERAE|nr:hypothetical protein MRB53_012675 [Persea americana]
MEEAKLAHVLVVAFPAQGNVNPVVRLAKRLASKGLLVTFSSTEAAGLRMKKATDDKASTSIPIGKGKMRFEFFFDDPDLNDPNHTDLDAFMERLEKNGPKGVADLIDRQANEGRPSCAVFTAYYHYCNDPTIKYPATLESEISVELPGMPVLAPADIPSFMLETNPYKSLTDVIVNQFKNIKKASWVLVESFMELERPIIEALEGKASLLPIGPLLKSLQDVESNTIRGDLWKSADCIEWLDSHEPGSVVYVSLGSVVVLDKEQLEEMAWGIKNSGRKFLWVVKPAPTENETGLPEWFLKETAERGMVVPWCPQEEVLLHPSVACFFTHCGWNSSMESLCSGVPIVGFPRRGDQMTNAKFLADVFSVKEDKGSLESREEVERCISEVVGGPRAEEMKKMAMKWKEAAAEAVSVGGSSDRNIQAVVDDIKQKAANLHIIRVDNGVTNEVCTSPLSN